MEKHTNRKAWLIAYTIFTIIGVAFATYKLLTVQTQMQILVAVTTLLAYALTMIYVAFAYKRPSNNFLGYVMLLFSASLIFDLNYCIYLEAKHFFVVTTLTMLLIAYISGRLEKVKENRILCVVVTLAMAYLWFNTSKNSGNIINTSASQLILWFNLRLAYNSRFVALQEQSDSKHAN